MNSKQTSTLRSLICLIFLTLLISCGSTLFIPKTVYVAPGQPVRLREDVKNVKIWVLSEDGSTWLPSTGTLHNGMFVLAKKPPAPPSD